MSRHIAWFSCGAASAVAAKLAVEKYGSKCEVVYCDTLASEHPDNRRFFADVERWLGRPIRVIRSDKYATIDDVFGYTCEEWRRASRFEDNNPALAVEWILIDQGVTKVECLLLDEVPLDAEGFSEDIECGPVCQTGFNFMRGAP